MLEINWVTILWEIINFVVITIALYFLVFKPIVKRSEARAKEKNRIMEEMLKDREEASIKLAEIEKRLNDVDIEIKNITDEAYEQNKVLQNKLLDATRQEANQILQDALLEVRKEQLVESRHHQSRMVDLVIRLTADTLRKVTPLSVHNALVDELAKKIWDMGKNEMQQVRAIRESLTERIASANVTVAYPLSPEQEMTLVRTFSALADTDVDVSVETDESLVAGLKVRIGDMVIDNSLAAQLAEIQDEVKTTLDQLNLEQDG